jgi:hypothetical protein
VNERGKDKDSSNCQGTQGDSNITDKEANNFLEQCKLIMLEMASQDQYHRVSVLDLNRHLSHREIPGQSSTPASQNNTTLKLIQVTLFNPAPEMNLFFSGPVSDTLDLQYISFESSDSISIAKDWP